MDIDLLVESEAFDAATELLTECRVSGAISPRSGRGTTAGSARASRSSAPANLELDLHRTFAMGPFGLTVDLDDLWAMVRSSSWPVPR